MDREKDRRPFGAEQNQPVLFPYGSCSRPREEAVTVLALGGEPIPQELDARQHTQTLLSTQSRLGAVKTWPYTLTFHLSRSRSKLGSNTAPLGATIRGVQAWVPGLVLETGSLRALRDPWTGWQCRSGSKMSVTESDWNCKYHPTTCQLCDCGLVTQPLCASVSSSAQQGQSRMEPIRAKR